MSEDRKRIERVSELAAEYWEKIWIGNQDATAHMARRIAGQLLSVRDPDRKLRVQVFS